MSKRGDSPMDTSNKKSIILDLRQATVAPLPQFVQYDTNILEFVIRDNGANADLSDVDRINVNYKRPDGVVISRLLTAVGNVVTYEFGTEEMDVPGYGEINIQLYEGEQRLSSKLVKVYFAKSIGPRFEQGQGLPLLQDLFIEVAELVESTDDAANFAMEQGAYAQEQGNHGKTQGDYAKAQGDYAKAQGDSVKSTVDTMNSRLNNLVGNTGNSNTEIVDARMGADNVVRANLGTLIREIHGQQLASARQTQSLQMGTQIINAPQSSPLDIQVEGRTQVSLGNSNLEGDKMYVLADKKTKVKVDNTVYSGIAKFKKKSMLTSKADFTGKVAGSTLENPHIGKFLENGATSLLLPNGAWAENTASGYSYENTLNGSAYTKGSNLVGGYAQHLFSFDLIAQVERNMGRIPKETVAEKVQWLKDNGVNLITFDWHGFGSSVGGSKASIKVWSVASNDWVTEQFHLNSTVTKLTITINSTDIVNRITSDGFLHFLAYAPASDGVTASQINTDFVQMQIDLKTTAQLDTRPILIRIATYEGKVSGSAVENPHVIKFPYNDSRGLTTLATPSNGNLTEAIQSHYQAVAALDAQSLVRSHTISGQIAQKLFPFDLIQEIERNLGRIPGANVADKVAWLKANIARITPNYHGYGVSPAGNKVNFGVWNKTNYTSMSYYYHTSNNVQRLGGSIGSVALANVIQDDGFIYALSWAEPATGNPADANGGVSTLYTDYIDLEIELKPPSDWRNDGGVMKPNALQNPRAPLYEVTQAEYDKILVSWTEQDVLNRYPIVEGVQSVQGLVITQESENLLPPFYEWTLTNGASAKSAYELEIARTTPSYRHAIIDIPVVAGQTYTISFVGTGKLYIKDGKNGSHIVYNKEGGAHTFTPTQNLIEVNFEHTLNGTYNVLDPMLNIGSTAKPFVPRNPNYLITDLKIRSVGDKKDILYQENGDWKRNKQIEEVVLDGSLGWQFWNVQHAGFKRVYCPSFSGMVIPNSADVLLKPNGLKVTFDASNVTGDKFYNHSNGLYLTIFNTDTGFGETYTPTADEIKGYFNGWRAKSVDANGKPTAWHSVVDGTDAPTQTLDYVKANKAPGYTGYKLFYVRSTPQTEVVTDKVEGALSVNGPTQVTMEVGAVVREKANPVYSSNAKRYYINTGSVASSSIPDGSKLKWRNYKILSIFKGLNKDNKWSIGNFGSAYIPFYGNQDAKIEEVDYDPTAEYYVTYIVLDRDKFTTNPTVVNGTYNQSMRSTVDQVIAKQTDNETLLSVHVKAIAELYKRIKALGG
jgi:hypothetical protein